MISIVDRSILSSETAKSLIFRYQCSIDDIIMTCIATMRISQFGVWSPTSRQTHHDPSRLAARQQRLVGDLPITEWDS